MNGYRLATELFTLPYLSQHIVYAPLSGTALLANAATVDLLAGIRGGDRAVPGADATETLALLMDLGVVEQAQQDARPVEDGLPRPQEEGAEFVPTACTIFLTSACNLRCRYCYAKGGDDPAYLDPRIAHAAVDTVVDNAIASGAEEVLVAFHGGGEPTLAAETLKACLAHARERADAEGIEVRAALATNGVMSRELAAEIGGSVDSVMVSVDGLADVHDPLRPMASGGGSFEAVDATLSVLDEAECDVGVRMTATEESVEGAPSFVRYLLDSHRLETIHLEPLFQCGRSVESGLAPPQPDRFVEAFRVCRAYAAGLGVKVAYSGLRPDTVALAFCQAGDPSFNVTTDGFVTACYEIARADDPRTGTFFFGRYDADRNAFDFDAEKIAALRRLNVLNASRCQGCFCKYHCAGDCPAKRLHADSAEALSARCVITRRLTQDHIEESLLGASTAVDLLAWNDGGPRGSSIYGEGLEDGGEVGR